MLFRSNNSIDWNAVFYLNGELASIIHSGPLPHDSTRGWSNEFRLQAQLPNIDILMYAYAPLKDWGVDEKSPIPITFYPNGQLQSGILQQSTELVSTGEGSAKYVWRPLKNTKGKMRKYGRSSFLFFSPEGLVDESKSKIVGCGVFGC